MISLRSLATEYRAPCVDLDGFDLEGELLRSSVERAIRRYVAERVATVKRLGPEGECPNIFKGELRAAEGQLRTATRDLAEVSAMRREVTAAE